MLVSPAGPFYSPHGFTRPGRFWHDGHGLVLLDDMAVGTLETLGDDFRVEGGQTARSPKTLIVGRDRWTVLPVGVSCPASAWE